uniref:Uncharacterized protein n=1 Tax=Oryza meridionalis TaxID=40149 RepID=A0A0E0FBU5_9ORYZ
MAARSHPPKPTAAASLPAGSGGGDGAIATAVGPPLPSLPQSGLQIWRREGAPTIRRLLLPSHHLPPLHLYTIRRHHACPPAPAGSSGRAGAAAPARLAPLIGRRASPPAPAGPPLHTEKWRSGEKWRKGERSQVKWRKGESEASLISSGDGPHREKKYLLWLGL